MQVELEALCAENRGCGMTGGRIVTELDPVVMAQVERLLEAGFSISMVPAQECLARQEA